jgi:dihydropteroate synthase
MGVLNVTPDSFSDGGHFFSPGEAMAAAHKLMEAGADLIDVGGESTRPGAPVVAEGEERRRLDLVVPRLQKEKIPFSVDTMKPGIARYALEHGASIVNDITGLRSPDMVAAVAKTGCMVCIMHMQGLPATMQEDPTYGDVVTEVYEFLQSQIGLALSAGVAPERIWIDPGIGFGKTVQHNLTLLQKTDLFVSLGYPVLIGVSRKGFIGRLLAAPGCEAANVPDRLPGSLAAQVVAQVKGARIIRTHDVKASLAAIKLTQAILDA